MPIRIGEVQALCRYPVKSMGGEEELAVFSPELAMEIGRRHGSPVEMMHLNAGIFDEASISMITWATVVEIGRLAALQPDVRRFRPNILIATAQSVPFEDHGMPPGQGGLEIAVATLPSLSTDSAPRKRGRNWERTVSRPPQARLEPEKSDRHSPGEDRPVLLARFSSDRLLAVMFTDRGAGRIRLISARPNSYAARCGSGVTVVTLDADVAKTFPDAASVNDALRALAKIAHRPPKKSSRPSGSASPAALAGGNAWHSSFF